jgi:SSS family solute:Na+ symporter
MLHRGAYSAAGVTFSATPQMSLRDRFRLRNVLHFDANFTFTDKLVSGGIFWWAMLLLGVNLVVSLWNLFYDWPVTWWSYYWMVAGIGFPLLIAVATLVWFGIGGVRDIIAFFAALRSMQRDESDDGRVPDATATAGESLPAAPTTPTADDAARTPSIATPTGAIVPPPVT